MAAVTVLQNTTVALRAQHTNLKKKNIQIHKRAADNGFQGTLKGDEIGWDLLFNAQLWGLKLK